jgi:hypothetical protein
MSTRPQSRNIERAYPGLTVRGENRSEGFDAHLVLLVGKNVRRNYVCAVRMRGYSGSKQAKNALRLPPSHAHIYTLKASRMADLGGV